MRLRPHCRLPLSFIAILSSGLGGCDFEDVDQVTTAPMASSGPGGSPVARSAADVGDFHVRIEDGSTADHRQMAMAFREERLFEVVAEGLNQELSLPHDVPIVLASCGEANAFYDPQQKEIRLCYELYEVLALSMAHMAETDDELAMLLMSSVLFTFFHELGHALVDIHQIPITGREEDAVDQLATAILVDAGPETRQMALSAALAFPALEGDVDPAELPFWGEHSLGAQRFYNIVCWVYGASGGEMQDLVGEAALPAERAARCPAEWQQIKASWERLLGSHRRSS